MAYTRLMYHVIYATKGRRPWIDQELEEFLYPIICRQFRLQDCHVVTLGGVEDHVHTVVGIPPTLAVSDVVRDVKRDSAKAVRRNLQRFRSFKWQKSFGAFTANPFAMQTLIDYVDSQKEHHHRGTIIDDFEWREERDADDDDSSES